MAILFMDSFDNYTSPNSKGWATSSAGIGAARNGNGMYCSGNKSGGYNGQCYIGLSASYGELIICGAVKSNGFSNDTWNWRLQEGATVHIELGISGGKLVARRGSGGTVLGTSSTSISNNVFYHIQIRVKIHDTAGTLKIAINGVTEINLTNIDTKNGGSGVINRFYHLSNGGPWYGEPTYTAYLDDFVIMDTSGAVNNDFIGDCKIECLQPNGNGNSSMLVGSDGNSTDNYLLVDEIPPDDDTSYVESSTTNNKDTYAYEDLTTLSGDVLGVQIATYAKKTEAAAHTIASIARLGGTEVDSSELSLATSYGFLLDRMETKPGGGSWTISDVNSSEFGVKVKT